MLPLCLMLDTTMPQASIAALNKIVTLMRPDEIAKADFDPAMLAQIKLAVCSPIKGFDPVWFDRLSHLQLIAVFGVGLDKVDLKKARERGIAVTITRDILTADTADMAFALLLAITRRIIAGDAMIRAGRWAAGEKLPHGSSLRGKKLGIVGLGAIGRDIARKAEAFGMEVSYYNRHRREDVSWHFHADLHELARVSDILAVAIAATADTDKIISASVLEALGEQGFLINIARGAVIDESALITALAERRIAGAGLDVFYNEPVINEAFFTLPNVVLAPHQGSATIETRLAMGQNVIDNIKSFLTEGYPLDRD